MPWFELDAELDLWRAAGNTATMWIRDDDAEAASAALVRLIGICDAASVPLALAVIPAGAERNLREALGGAARTQVLQHGWAHQNHAGAGEKKAELGDHRSVDDIFAQLDEGRRRLEDLFADRFLPVVAPPWNRIGAGVASRLAARNYLGLSTFGPRGRSVPAPGIVRVNTHVDVFDWRCRRAYRGDAAVVGQAVEHLRARRLGQADRDEPTGLITHHLIHDEGCWGFIERFLERYSKHPAVRWPAVSEIFAMR